MAALGPAAVKAQQTCPIHSQQRSHNSAKDDAFFSKNDAMQKYGVLPRQQVRAAHWAPLCHSTKVETHQRVSETRISTLISACQRRVNAACAVPDTASCGVEQMHEIGACKRLSNRRVGLWPWWRISHIIFNQKNSAN